MRAALCGLLLWLISCSATLTQPNPKAVLPPLVPDVDQPHLRLELHADTGFLPSERRNLLKAADIWREQTSGVADIIIVFDLDFDSAQGLQEHVNKDHHLLKRLEGWMDEVVTQDKAIASELGLGYSKYTPQVLGEIHPLHGIHAVPARPVYTFLVADRLYERHGWVQVPLHEFGHIMGLLHTVRTGGIMDGAYTQADPVCLTVSDLIGFCTVNECGTLPMKPCKRN